MVKSQLAAVEPHQERCLWLDGVDAGDVLLAIVGDVEHVLLNVFLACFEPWLALAVSHLGGEQRGDVGVTQFVHLNPSVELGAQLGVLDDQPGALQAWDVERFAWRAAGDGDGGGVVAHGGQRGVLVAKECDVAKHLVAEEDHIVLACKRCHLLEFFFFPHYANGVLWVAHHHDAWLLLNEHALQVVEVHAIEVVASGHQVVAHCQAMVAFDHVFEVVVHWFLQHHSVARTGEEVQYHSQGGHSSGHERHFLAAYLEAVAPALPVDDGLPVLVVGVGIAIDGMLAQALYQCLANLGANGKVHVGNP